MVYGTVYSTTNISMERWNHEYKNKIPVWTLKSPIKYSSAKNTDSSKKGVSS
jgi:hypothetical protein